MSLKKNFGSRFSEHGHMPQMSHPMYCYSKRLYTLRTNILLTTICPFKICISQCSGERDLSIGTSLGPKNLANLVRIINISILTQNWCFYNKTIIKTDHVL